MNFRIASRNDLPGGVAARDLLESLIAEVYGLSPLPRINKTKNGKPYFQGFPHVFFSLSHSKNYVMAACSDTPIGCDIEEERRIPGRLPSRVCSEDELAVFSFFDLWVLKEAYIKLTDVSLASMPDIHFSRDKEIFCVSDVSVQCKLLPVSYTSAHAAVCFANP